MSEHDQPGAPGPDDHGIGSVGEEAAKLFGAIADMARERGSDIGDGLGGLAGHAAAMAKDVDGHFATGAEECRYCPVCRVVHAVRETSPEVRAHLMVAASSLLQAAAALMESTPPKDAPGSPHRGAEVERIDLDDEGHDDGVTE
ncbi:hypothetical protein HNR19_002629 [Nocardioides thalensis]|uniref:Uncharacterized protein n=1 Tax=Nocardioides thalensis TaxID=1914755 RepID=A0A853C457_9ACTN|nr:hypothetical protein [Nocardioides thalensis]NYJ01931.1 hypothetical protein [Nocardioides thalensis]